jgi:hypothetical protein
MIKVPQWKRVRSSFRMLDQPSAGRVVRQPARTVIDCQNQDYMDCRPDFERKTGVEAPEWMQKMIERRKAEREPPRRAIHFICGRDDGVSLNNLVVDKASGTFRSGQWDISEEDARSLVGGWVYLHAAKASPSEFGGIVLGFEPVVDASLAHSAAIEVGGSRNVESPPSP